MIDPKRWLEDEDASGSLEARVLGAGVESPPPAGLEERVWAELVLLAREPVSAAAHGDATAGPQAAAAQGVSAAGGGAIAAAVVKAGGVGALLGVLTMSAAQVLSPQAPTQAPGAHEAATPRARAVRARSPAVEARQGSAQKSDVAATANLARANELEHAGRTRELVANGRRAQGEADARRIENDSGEAAQLSPGEKAAQAEAARAAFPSLPEPEGGRALTHRVEEKTRQSELRAEALELAQAKNLLQQRRAGEALALLEAGSGRFANGMLGAERELLTVQALSVLGKVEEARARALVFLATHPGSSISSRMQRWLEKSARQ